MALENVDSVRGNVSTLNAAPEKKVQEIATQWFALGRPRICPLGQMQNRADIGGMMGGRRWNLKPNPRDGSNIKIKSK